MKRKTRHLLYWTPRLLCAAFVIFISMFTIEVFQARLPFWRMLLMLATYLVLPTIMAAVLVLAWRWPWVGGIGYTALGLYFLWLAKGPFIVAAYFIVAGPAFLIALLFFANWIWRAELRESN